MSEGDILWVPSTESVKRANITRFRDWLEQEGRAFDNYEELWQWSTDSLEQFWDSIWRYFALPGRGTSPVLAERQMPGAVWFRDSMVNYAQALLRPFATPDREAILWANETGARRSMTVAELSAEAGALAQTLKNWGVGPGDRVAAYLPNIPQTVVAFIAAASLGAVWSVCSPDFGVPSVVDRFQQIAPKVLLVVDGYPYQGRWFDRTTESRSLRNSLSSVEHTIAVSYQDPDGHWMDPGVLPWRDAVQEPHPLTFREVPFAHPLWVLYSSGTTGLPKPIVHSHGGMLLSHLVNGSFHLDLTPQDRFFWFSTTGWMMWNVVVSGLLAGSTIILYDGSPVYPGPDALWRWAAREEITIFGTSAAFLQNSMKAAIQPKEFGNWSHLRAVASTGSPLTPEGFEWVYGAVKSDVWLAPASGGTDICAAFVGGCPILPVRSGEMQCRALGAKVQAYDVNGSPVIDVTGELVVTEPMPSMPIYLWGDNDGSRYRSSYFDMYPGVWRHGDWIRITSYGSAIIYGRSDSTINRYGVRMGSSDIYRVVETVPGVKDSLVVDLEYRGGRSFMALFIKIDGENLEVDQLRQAVRDAIKSRLSPRHLPDDIVVVPDIPKTLNGKKLEVPVRRILQGVQLEAAVSLDAMANPECLDVFVAYAKTLTPHPEKG